MACNCGKGKLKRTTIKRTGARPITTQTNKQTLAAQTTTVKSPSVPKTTRTTV